MMRYDLLIVGSGPAGMAAAVTARRYGLSVLVVDEQASPGGQIWRAVELSEARDEVLGPSYVEGRAAAATFRESGADYHPGARLWQLETGYRAFLTRDGEAYAVEAGALLMATGAQERPAPFPGWTLPGVLTVGAAQILLKSSGQIPSAPVWVAGSGPLPLLYAVQLLRAGGQIAGYLDTTPRGQLWAAFPRLPGAIHAAGDILKGLSWTSTLRTSRVPYVRGVRDLSAFGNGRIERLQYRIGDGSLRTVDANLLLVHEGVVPNLHPALSLGCELSWDEAQECFKPSVDAWGETSCTDLFVAGDGAGIAGAKAAQARGEISAIRIAVKLGRLDELSAKPAIARARRALAKQLSVRPFLDALFRPRAEIFAPSDETIVCRCEEVTAREVRAASSVGCPGPNQVKAATRCGMGPCQGRQCGYSLTRILAESQKRCPADVGYLHIRPPLKPVTLGELAALYSKGVA